MAALTVEKAALLMPMLVNKIDDPLFSCGHRPNNAHLIGIHGRGVLRQQWNNPAERKAAIQCYLDKESRPPLSLVRVQQF